MSDSKSEQAQEQEQAPKAQEATEANADGLPLPTRGTPDASGGCPAIPLPEANTANTVLIDRGDPATGSLSDGDTQQGSSQAQQGSGEVSLEQAPADKDSSKQAK